MIGNVSYALQKCRAKRDRSTRLVMEARDAGDGLRGRRLEGDYSVISYYEFFLGLNSEEDRPMERWQI